MTTIDTHVGASTKSSGSSVVASVGQWVTSSDHKKIGRLFIGWSLVHAIEVAVLGAIFGLERMSPSSMQIFSGDAALQLSWLFRHVLVLGLIAPLFIGLAIAVVPMQIGSKAISFARLAQYGFWAWFFGSALTAATQTWSTSSFWVSDFLLLVCLQQLFRLQPQSSPRVHLVWRST